MQTEVVVPTLITAGGLILALLLPAVVAMWQETKDIETAIFFFSLSAVIFQLLSPLVVQPLVLLDASATRDMADRMLHEWSQSMAPIVALLLLVPLYKLSRENRWHYEAAARFSAWLSPKVSSRAKTLEDFAKDDYTKVRPIAGAIAIGLFWLAHWGMRVVMVLWVTRRLG